MLHKVLLIGYLRENLSRLPTQQVSLRVDNVHIEPEIKNVWVVIIIYILLSPPPPPQEGWPYRGVPFSNMDSPVSWPHGHSAVPCGNGRFSNVTRPSSLASSTLGRADLKGRAERQRSFSNTDLSMRWGHWAVHVRERHTSLRPALLLGGGVYWWL